MITYLRDEDLSYTEYRDFLTRTSLGSQYPAEGFEQRVSTLIRNRSLAITARDAQNQLVGVCFGLTDFAYFLFITDLGVDCACERQGIGAELMTRIHEAAGGMDDISVVTVSNRRALGFYQKLGLESDPTLVWKSCKVWTSFKVS